MAFNKRLSRCEGESLYQRISFKLLLDFVPSFSENVTRAMHGQPKRLYYLRRNRWNVIEYVLISFHSIDLFCAHTRLSVRPGFRLFCARLAVNSLSGSLFS